MITSLDSSVRLKRHLAASLQSGNDSSLVRENSAVVADTATSTSTRPHVQQELLARYKPLLSDGFASTEVDASDGSAMTHGALRPGQSAAQHRSLLTAASPMHHTRRVSMLSYDRFQFQHSQGTAAQR